MNTKALNTTGPTGTGEPLLSFKIPLVGDRVIDHSRIIRKVGEITYMYTDFSGEVELPEECAVQFIPNRKVFTLRYNHVTWYTFRELKDNWSEKHQAYILNY